MISYDRADRIWEKEDAQAIIAKCTGKPATVEEQSKKNTPKLAAALRSHPRCSGKRTPVSVFRPKTPWRIAQALYERHKVLTYPRTDSKHLPEDYLQSVKEIVCSAKLAGNSVLLPGGAG